MTWQYIYMIAITFLVIFTVVIGIIFVYSLPEAKAMLSEDAEVLLFEQNDTNKPQPEIMNINTMEYHENVSQGKIEDDTLQYINLGEFRLTAYCSCSKCCGKYANNRPKDKSGNEIVYTASGKVAKSGYTIAADPSVLPYGSIVYINGHKYEVQDKGGTIKGNRIDIYFDSHKEACEFGVQYADVFTETN